MKCSACITSKVEKLAVSHHRTGSLSAVLMVTAGFIAARSRQAACSWEKALCT